VNVLDRLIGWFSPHRGVQRAQARAALVRAYEGAARTDGWRPRRAGASANSDHASDARELRIRARSLVQNVPYITRGLQALVSATIGTGIEPRAIGRNAKRINALWTDWAKVADADEIFDIHGLMAAAYRAMEQDGEVLIRRRSRRVEDGLPVPLQVQLLEIDWLDSTKSGQAAGGGQIVNGIEYDVLGKPRAYWLYGAHPGDATRTSVRLDSKPIPAADIIHLFAPTRPGQGRGITRLAPIIARVRDLMLYEDAELARKNLETRLGLAVSGDVSALANAPTYASGDRPYGDLGELPSGGITQLPPGLNVTSIDPKPAGAFVEYCKHNLHLIAAGLGVPYESMTGDMVEVNFSSARIRRMDFRHDCEQMQWLVIIPRLGEPLWQWFLEAVDLSGKASIANVGVDWSTPRWDYVNPYQDVRAETEAIGAGLMSPSEALRQRGYKPDEVFAEIGADFQRLQNSGALNLMQLLLTSGRHQVPAAG
jgi:lambda family phage portal protein